MIEGKPMALYTQFASTVPEADLKDFVGSLENQRYAVMEAIDMLISGY
jgi:CcdB protein